MGTLVLVVGAATVSAAIFYWRTTPEQRAAMRQRTNRIEGSREWQRGPHLTGAGVLLWVPPLFLPHWTAWVFWPIGALLIIVGLISMIIANRRYG